MPTIKQEMNAIDLRQHGWWNTLTEDEQKKLSMWVLQRYSSSVKTSIAEIEAHYLIMTNDLVNVNHHVLRHHPELQMRLLQCVGIGTSQLHEWVPPPPKKKAKQGSKVLAFYLNMYPHLSDDEAIFVLDSMGKDEVKEMLLEAGIPKKSIKDYVK
jgi:hypothetical protein